MPLEQIFVLSLIQGLTEFIPVSSSAHLLLVSTLCGWKDQGLIMDVAAHFGTLGSVLVYFRADVISLFQGFFSLLKGKKTLKTDLFLNLVIATIPVVFLGTVFDMLIGDAFRGMMVIAWMSIIFGVLLYIADRYGAQKEKVSDTTLRRALYFGLGQCLSLINGVSRSGSCIMVGRFLNYTRQEAAHFAFLMAIPTMIAACTLKGYQLFKNNDFSLLNDAALMAGLSFVFGFCTISFMMNWLKSATFTPFVIYRILLGLTLLASTF
jgi:undecaprenyl-diphosphatase